MLALILARGGHYWRSELAPAQSLRLVAGAVLLAVALGTWLVGDPLFYFTIVVSAGVGLVACWHRPPFRFALLIVLGISLGLWRWSAVNLERPDDITLWHNQEVTWQGEVVEVDRRLDQIKLTTRAITVDDRRNTVPVSGLVMINVSVSDRWQIGDRFTADCRLVEPPVWEDFDYQRYLRRFGIETLCQYPRLRSTGEISYSPYRLIGQVKDYFSSQLDRVIGEPAGGIIQGMILGSAHRIDPELYQLFVRLGLSHIIAISGSHIALIVVLLLAVLIRLGLNRYQALPVLAVMISAYVVLVGSPASALRAAMMGIVMLIGQYYGRVSASGNALLLAAAGLVLLDPYALLFDIGFQLSFAAVIGLVYLSPLIDQLLFKILPWRLIREVITLTVAAQIATAPLIIFYFARLSIAGLLANLFIMPIVPLLMVLSILTIILAPVAPLVATFVGLLVSLLVDYWTAVALFWDYWIGVSIDVGQLPLPVLVISYLFLIVGLRWAYQRWYNPII